SDVRARVSDRRLLRAILAELGVSDEQTAGVFAVVDKIDRQPRDVSHEKFSALGLAAGAIERLFALMGDDVTLDQIERDFGASPAVAERLNDFRRYFDYLDGLGVLEWATIDLKIVR